MLTCNYQYKLKPTKRQIVEIEKYFTACRKVWNYALAQRKDWSKSRKSDLNKCSLDKEYIIPADTPYPSYKLQTASLTEARKVCTDLKDVNAQVLQQVLRQLDRAFAQMKSLNKGFPRFKNKYRMRSFVFPQFKTNPIANNYIKLPSIGLVKMKLSRPIPEGFVLKQARVIRKASGYFINLCFQADVNIPNPFPHGNPLGIDIGLDYFVATSNNELIKRPRFFNKLHRQLRLLQRRLKNKPIGSNNRHRLNRKIARLHQAVSETRKDFHYKLAHRLCDGNGMVFVEDIDFRAWGRNMLCKHNLDASFGQFFEILSHVCWKRDVYFAKVDKNYTSQICPNCGVHTGKKNKSERVHTCPECGFSCNRDFAASLVIRNRGLNKVASAEDTSAVYDDRAVGHTVLENACGDGLTGFDSKIKLVKNL
ncbi:putative transposase IS605 family [Gloeothece citriformis PCC 7424]|uniref:Putative transposase IS605 family n=1 Tax=Gloeothece citriformis (strain PCC 7424) TaxID=65393 RepID=B7K7L1_GLOC7|nr:RNA-guided endonuclease TnpB family protein [Gloeothece citriformis]ACK69779.1 putative transposase IS605 family [Gloeothece citriformis PCC 7424]